MFTEHSFNDALPCTDHIISVSIHVQCRHIVPNAFAEAEHKADYRTVGSILIVPEGLVRVGSFHLAPQQRTGCMDSIAVDPP
jgi:hypothetical protein